MAATVAETTSFPVNTIASYIHGLKETKPGLPYGHPICVAACPAISTTAALLRLANLVGPYIAVFQIQADIIDDWSSNTMQELISLAQKHNFLLWEGGRYLVAERDMSGLSPAETRQRRQDLVEIPKKQYTRGVVSIASWANLATFWPSSTPARQQESDIIISALKGAARETVTKVAQVIKTEITVENNLTEQDGQEDVEESITFESTLLPPIEFSKNTLEPPTRRTSTISLTHSIVQRSEPSPTFITHDVNQNEGENVDQNAQWLMKSTQPPLLARGLILGLPPRGGSSFSTAWYRDSCLAAGRANRDFIVGFYCLDSWLEVSRWRDVLHSADEEGHEATVADDEKDRLFVIFSRLPYDIHQLQASQLDIADDEQDSANPEDPNSEARLLHTIMEQAMESVREAEQRDGTQTLADPGLLHVPIITLGP